MDEKLQKQLIRQMKILNFWITTLGISLLIALAVVGFFLWQVVSAVQTAATRIETFQTETREQLNVKKQLCEGDGAVSRYLGAQDFCKE